MLQGHGGTSLFLNIINQRITKNAKTLALLPLLAGAFMAAYVWNPQDGSTDWSAESNWTLTNGSAWSGTGSGPMTTGSNMWDEVVINNGDTLTGLAFEGWNPCISLSNGSSLTATLVKIQSYGVFNVDEGSTLNITITGSGGYKENTHTFNIEGALVFDMDGKYGGSGNMATTVMTIGDNASVTINNATFVSDFTLNANLVGGSVSADNPLLFTRDLISSNTTINGIDKFTFNFGDGWEDVGDGDITHAGQYKILNTASGIAVQYMVPEPATAALSLLALAGLAARRRRK